MQQPKTSQNEPKQSKRDKQPKARPILNQNDPKTDQN